MLKAYKYRLYPNNEPKEYIADIVKRKLAYDIKNLINRKYNMDDLFERTILDMDKE